MDDRLFSNFKRAFNQFESDEVPGVELKLRIGGSVAQVTSDDDGYFFARVPLVTPAQTGWQRVEAEVLRAPYPLSAPTTGEGWVLVPGPEARFGVISDIDDTILRTHVENKAKMLYLTLLGNALTRLSFRGTTELYQGLLRAGDDAPFFYVSHSMWNIYPLLEHFIAHQRLPRGPLLLRDVGLFRARPVRHKMEALEQLLGTYPELPFVLIGDSGERDLDIYLAAARAHPRQIMTLMIRNVSSFKRANVLRDRALGEAPPGCSTLVFDHTEEAIAHCQRLGLWRTPSLLPAPLSTGFS
jgi:phosphatidate phosphatase APP1